MKAAPIVLGWDGQRWTSGELEARVLSLSEPDKAVPLTAQLQAVPDILEFAVESGSKDEFRARVSLKSAAELPADDRAHITLIADPMFELAQAVMGAAAGMAIPSPVNPKDMRAEVEVHLMPYELRLKATEGERTFDVERDLSLEGDRTSLVLEAAVYRVDARGNPGQDPLPDKVEIRGSLEGVVMTPGENRVQLAAEKPRFREALKAGKLELEARLSGGRVLKRSVMVQVKPLDARLEVSPAARLKLGSGTLSLKLTVANSQGKPVVGLPTAWKLAPSCGTLSAAEAATDGAGAVQLTYSGPGDEEAQKAFTGPTLSVGVQVTSKGEPVVDQSLELEYFSVVTITVEKAGFETQSGLRLELDRPGGVLVQLTAPTPEHDAVAYAKVTGLGKAAVSDKNGQVTLGSSAVNTREVLLSFDQQTRDLVDLLSREARALDQADWATARLRAAVKRVEEFVPQFLVRVAAAEPEQVPHAQTNAKLLHTVVRVGEASARLFERRFGRAQEQLNSCLGNLAGAFYSWLGERYFPKLGELLGRGGRYLFGTLAKKLAGSRHLGKIRGLATRVRGWVDGASAKIEALRGRMRGKKQTLPQAMQDRLPRGAGDGPFKPGGRLVVPDKELVEAAEKAAREVAQGRQALAQAQKSVEKLRAQGNKLQRQLADARTTLGTPGIKSETAKRWERTIKELEGQLAENGTQVGQAAEAVTRADQVLKDALEADKSARGALETLKSACDDLGELLSACMDLFNRVYQYGAWYLALALVWIAEVSSRNLREIAKKIHPQSSDALSNSIDDLVFKAAFTKAFELGGAYMLGPAIHWTLRYMHGNAVGEAIVQAAERSKSWQERDKEECKKAIRWYYEEIDAASFKSEEAETWAEMGAELADWAEWIAVWVTRGVNLILAIVTIILGFVTAGTALPVCLTVTAGFSAAVEMLDRFWDLAKAGGRSLTLMASSVELWGVVLPAHQTFTAKLYQDDSLRGGVDAGWSYPISEELDKKLRELHKPGSLPGEQKLEAAYQKATEILSKVPGLDD